MRRGGIGHTMVGSVISSTVTDLTVAEEGQAGRGEEEPLGEETGTACSETDHMSWA
jgi:hypothetical protein